MKCSSEENTQIELNSHAKFAMTQFDTEKILKDYLLYVKSLFSSGFLSFS